jgi:hypothetical protein
MIDKKCLFFVPILTVLLLSSCGQCDGVAFHLYKVYEQWSGYDLTSTFDNLIDENTEILSDCAVINFSEPNASYLPPRLQEYSFERFDVSYRCDILSFNIDLYKKGNIFYFFSPETVQCKLFGDVDVFFHDSADNLVEMWYSTDYLLEYIVIGEHINDKSFCTGLETKLFGEFGDHCK